MLYNCNMVITIRVEGYKPFFGYESSNITVYVNSQDQFTAGLKDVHYNVNTLSEERAESLRNGRGPYKIESKEYAEYYRNRLQVNGFDLEKE